MLIPFCVVITRTTMSLIAMIQPDSADIIPPAGWALGLGYLLWLLLYFTLPRPVKTYVLAHELTHALWGLMRGARIHRMRVSKEGGSVTLSKSDFLIALAPYFFPLYTVLVIVIYYIVSIFVEMEGYYLYWLGFVGFTWGFHFTFTISMLSQRQSDIQQYGYIFSYAVIYFFNIAGIGFWTVIVSSVTIGHMIELMGVHTHWVWVFIKSFIAKNLQ